MLDLFSPIYILFLVTIMFPPTCLESLKNQYPVDSAIQLSYNRPWMRGYRHARLIHVACRLLHLLFWSIWNTVPELCVMECTHCSRTRFSLLYMRATMHCYISLLIRKIHRTMIYNLFVSKCTFQTFLLVEFCPSLRSPNTK